LKVEDAVNYKGATDAADHGNTPQSRMTVTVRRQLAVALMGPWRLAPIVISLAAIWAFFAAQSPIFLTSRNLTNLTNQIAVSTAVALALVFILVVRQVDISLAALAAVAGGIAGRLTVDAHWSLALAICAALAFGILVGVVQATIVTVFNAPSFIVTLGGLFVLNAILLWLLPVTAVIPLAGTPLQGVAGSFLPEWLSYVLGAAVVSVFAALRLTYHRARRREGIPSRLLTRVVVPAIVLAILVVVLLVFVFNAYRGVPTPAVIIVACSALLAYVAGQTPFGRHLYAIGGNPEAARRAGIPVGLMTVSTFALGGCLAALAGILSASRQLGVSAQSSDLTLLLGALAAVVIGGVSLFGGRGSVWAALIGGLVIGSIQNGLDLINSSTQIQWTVEGLVLICAVVIDALIARNATPRGRM
jgi:D-xylose transport system permease protein